MAQVIIVKLKSQLWQSKNYDIKSQNYYILNHNWQVFVIIMTQYVNYLN